MLLAIQFIIINWIHDPKSMPMPHHDQMSWVYPLFIPLHAGIAELEQKSEEYKQLVTETRAEVSKTNTSLKQHKQQMAAWNKEISAKVSKAPSGHVCPIVYSFKCLHWQYHKYIIYYAIILVSTFLHFSPCFFMTVGRIGWPVCLSIACTSMCWDSLSKRGSILIMGCNIIPVSCLPSAEKTLM